MNWWLLLVTAVIPLIVGSIYYNPKVLGNAWMKESGMTMEKAEKANMLKVFGLSYVLGIMISMVLSQLVIHQMSLNGIFEGTDFKTPGTAAYEAYQGIMGTYGDRYRTLSHGFVHGGLISFLLVWPILSINAMFEQRGWKYVAIHLGYWFITLAAMSAVICAYL